MKPKAFLILPAFLLAAMAIAGATTFCAATPAGTPASGDYYYEEDVMEAKIIDDITEDIKLTAFDEYDGELTDVIDVTDWDDYEICAYDPWPMNRSLGTYRLEYCVKDHSGNEASLTVYVVVVDNKPPIIKDESVTFYEEDIDNITLTSDIILDNIVASDEYCQENVTKKIVTGSVHSLEHIKDIQQHLMVQVSDSSDNTVICDVSVVFRDRTRPTITLSADTITTSYYADVSLDNLLATINVTVSDNYDENLTYRVYEDNYTANNTKVGNFIVKLAASDTSHNTTLKPLTVNIIDDIPPVFYIDISKVYVKTDFKLAARDFIKLLQDAGKIQEPHYDFSVTEDSYSASANTEGTYDYFCRLSYPSGKTEDFQFQVNVLPATVQQKLQFHSLFLAFKQIVVFIWKVLKWPLGKLKQLL